MSNSCSMSQQSDGLGGQQQQHQQQPTKTISGEKGNWYHDFTDWQWIGGLM